MIEVRNVTKMYGDLAAVSELSFTVEEGRIYGFLGPNGAGKTTTMNILCGYIGATSGDVLLNGHSILDEPLEAKKCIGYLPELPPLYPEMTVQEYLDFVAEIKHIDKAERAAEVDRVLAATGTADVRARLIRNLSKGYHQRVGLAQALLGMPPILVLDEPTVGLDPKQIIEMRDLIRSLAKGRTVLLSSHILSEISAVCDECLILSKGRLVASGTPDELEAMLHSLGGLLLTVEGPAAKARKVLESAVDKASVTAEPCSQKGCCTFAVANAKDDARNRIFLAFAEAKLPIVEMKRARASLEDVFLDLTSDGPSEIAQAEAAEKEAKKK